ARDQAALNLSYTRITAPAEGVVSKKTVEVGQLVQPGQPLMSLVPLGDVWVTANLKETQTADVSPGDPADFTVDAYPGRHFSGHVESLPPSARTPTGTGTATSSRSRCRSRRCWSCSTPAS